MNTFERKITLRVFGAHAAIIFLMVAIPALRGCFKPKPKEIVTFIEFGAPADPVNIQQVSKMAEPEPPAPTPTPEPEPAPIPEPSKPKPKPKAEPKPKPKPKEPEKPKWKPVSAKDIKIGKKVAEKSSKPSISSADIKKALAGIASSAAASGNPSQFNDYYARVISLFYGKWKPPASASSATGSAIVRISMRKNGQITKRAKIKSSGDPLYDRTVMEAVNAVSTLPRPPSTYPYDYVEVTFTLDN
jgi:TonB family protein